MSNHYALTNPATGRVESTFETLTDDELQAALDQSTDAFERWRSIPVQVRAARLAEVASLYLERRGELAKLVTREMGKPISQAEWEIGLVADIYQYYADKGPEILVDSPFEPMGGGKAVIRKAPLGPLLGIMPWNFPYYQVARFAAPNLVAGNTLLIKPAPQCPESALAMEQIFVDAGVLPSAYINLFATNEQVGGMLADPRVVGASVTGSERAGLAVAEAGGRNLKKVILELGGSDPFIVLDDADVKKAVADAVAARMFNAGQGCNSPKRMIVLDGLYDEFVEGLVAGVADVTWGDPMDQSTALGPMGSSTAADALVAQISDAVDKGATLHVGGRRVEGPGSFVEPTVLTGITTEMRACHEELFGPVAVVYRASSVDEAVERANSTAFGLGASIYSTDTARAIEVGDRLDVGMVWINSPEGSAPDLPFGGVKRSGIGRELGSLGIEEFVNKKTVYVP